MRKVHLPMEQASTLVFCRTAPLSRLSRWSRRKARARVLAPMTVTGLSAHEWPPLLFFFICSHSAFFFLTPLSSA